MYLLKYLLIDMKKNLYIIYILKIKRYKVSKFKLNAPPEQYLKCCTFDLKRQI